MADARTNRTDSERQSSQAIARQQRDRDAQGIQRWEPFGSPFELMDRMSAEMDQVFDRVFGGVTAPRRSWLSRLSGSRGHRGHQGLWAPRVEAIQKGDRFVVRAELPGLKRDDVEVEVRGDSLSIRGERRDEHEEEREGYFHSELEYGQFHRTIPLPEGVIADSAQASFRNGVLEVTMQAAPAEANRGRKIDIKDQ
jgi:HSP20 family protein